MSKFWCCGTSRKKEEESNEPEFQLLLLGTDESGKLNIIEKLANLQNQFTHENRINMTVYIKRHILHSLTKILQNLANLSPSIKLEHPENQWRVAYILTTAQQKDFNYPSEFFEHVAILWADAGVKSCFEQSKRDQLINFTTHFLDCVHQVKKADYIPTDQDMIHSRFFKSNVYQMSFDFNPIKYRLIEIDLLRRERQKWVHCFSLVNAILFVVDCSNFNLQCLRDNFEPDLFESINKFRMIMANPWLWRKPVIVLLNKQDLLANKIKNGFRAEDCFREYDEESSLLVDPVEVNLDEDPEINRAKYFIRNQFLEIRTRHGTDKLRCYPHFICDSDIETTRLIFDDCRKIIRQQTLD